MHQRAPYFQKCIGKHVKFCTTMLKYEMLKNAVYLLNWCMVLKYMLAVHQNATEREHHLTKFIWGTCTKNPRSYTMFSRMPVFSITEKQAEMLNTEKSCQYLVHGTDIFACMALECTRKIPPKCTRELHSQK